MATYYDVLGCPPDASYEKLKQAYHSLILKCHPDKANVSRNTEDPSKFLLIKEAWINLRDPDKRKAYDAQLMQSTLDEEYLLYGTFRLDEMDFDPTTKTYTLMCRCGGLYSIPELELEGCDMPVVQCNECSFNICVNNVVQNV